MLFLGASLWAVIKVMEPRDLLEGKFQRWHWFLNFPSLFLSSQWLQISCVLHKNCLWFLRVHNRGQAIRHHGGISIWLPEPPITGSGVHSVLGLFTLARAHRSVILPKIHSCVLNPFLIYVFALLYVSVCICIYIWCGRYTCHSMSEVRGQLCGVSSLLPPFRGFRRSNCLPGLCDKYLTHWVVLASLSVLFLNTSDEATSSALPKILQTLSSLSCSALCVNTSGADFIHCTRTWYRLPGELSECLAQHVIMSVMGSLFLPGLLLCL